MTEEKKASEGSKPKLPKIDFKLEPEFIKGRLKELWEGKIPLVHCFWIYYFAVVVVLSILASVLGGLLGGLLNLIMLAWAAFMVMPVMRSAEKYEGDKMWSLLAKVAAVLIAISVAAGILNLLAS
jgi:hypothetical protein